MSSIPADCYIFLKYLKTNPLNENEILKKYKILLNEINTSTDYLDLGEAVEAIKIFNEDEDHSSSDEEDDFSPFMQFYKIQCRLNFFSSNQKSIMKTSVSLWVIYKAFHIFDDYDAFTITSGLYSALIGYFIGTLVDHMQSRIDDAFRRRVCLDLEERLNKKIISLEPAMKAIP